MGGNGGRMWTAHRARIPPDQRKLAVVQGKLRNALVLAGEVNIAVPVGCRAEHATNTKLQELDDLAIIHGVEVSHVVAVE